MRAFWDPVQRQHTPGFFLQRGRVRANFEAPGRADALLAGLTTLGITPALPAPIDDAALLAVHDAAYLDFLAGAWAEWAALDDAGPEMVANVHPSAEIVAQGATPGGIFGRLGWYTADTACPIGPATWPAARAAAACAIAAADAVRDGGIAYALARPPGHHAYAARAGGHCYLNNTAAAAQRLRAHGAARVGVLDIDAHHGNGTQGIFWTRGDVRTASVHGDPADYYPWYVGHGGERGAGAGQDANLNLPLPRGTADGPWLDGFARAAAMVAARGLPTVVVQEGGYNLATLGPLLACTLGAFG